MKEKLKEKLPRKLKKKLHGTRRNRRYSCLAEGILDKMKTDKKFSNAMMRLVDPPKVNLLTFLTNNNDKS